MTVGDYVVIVSCGDATLIGKTGKILQDDHDHSPYRVSINGVQAGVYFKEAAVRRATMVSDDAGHDPNIKSCCMLCVKHRE